MTPGGPQLRAVLDDAASMRTVVELCSLVARGLSRGLELVYVESAPALQAAALPFAQVLAYGGASWQPLAQRDVEMGYRAQAARLREVIQRSAMRQPMTWTMRVMRGALPDAALALRAQGDLLFVACAASAAPPASRASRSRRRRTVSVLVDDSPSGHRALQVAQQVATAMDASLTIRHATDKTVLQVVQSEACDLLVLPGGLLLPQMLAKLTLPALCVD